MARSMPSGCDSAATLPPPGPAQCFPRLPGEYVDPAPRSLPQQIDPLPPGSLVCTRVSPARLATGGLIPVRVRLVQVGGPAPGTAENPVAHGWVEARATGGRTHVARTSAGGAAVLALEPGSYAFLGREHSSDGYYCSAARPRISVSRTGHSPAAIKVICSVP